MREKPLVSRVIADQDIDDVVDHYSDAAGADTASKFVGELTEAKCHISEAPRRGSLRYASTLGAPALRHRKVGRFPYLIFYLDHPDRIEIVRVLHAARDIPVWLSEPDADD